MRIRALLGAALMSVGVASSARAAEASPDALIVKRAPGLGAAELRERADLEAAGRVPGLARVDVVEPADGDPARALAELRADPEVRWAEPVLPRHATAADTRFEDQWGLVSPEELDADIDAAEAWEITRGAGVTVAVVDTGIALAHPDLAPQLTGNPGERGAGRETNGKDDDRNGLIDDWRGWDFAGDDNRSDDGGGDHGTHVAGIAAAAEGGGDVVGVAPQAALLPLQALDADGDGTSRDTAAAFAYAGRLGVRVVNASFAAGEPSSAELEAIRNYPDTLFVAAAGNDGDDVDDAPTYPCAYDEPNVVCVGASDDRDQRPWFSNYGRETVDLFAPGEHIWSTVPTGYAQKDGTSMAAPHVAGTAALLASLHSSWTPELIREALIATADDDSWAFRWSVSRGRLNAAAALGWTAPSGADDESPAPGPERVATTPADWRPPATPPASTPAPRTPAPAPPAPAPQTPAPAPRPPAPVPPTTAPTPVAPAASPLVSRLRIVGRPGKPSAKLSFTASTAGSVQLVVERRTGRRYKRAGSATLAVAAGNQRTRLGKRVAGARLKRGKWRLVLGTARVTFRVG